MSPVPAGHLWSLPAVGGTSGSRRHVSVVGTAFCSPRVKLGTALTHEFVMSHPACKRCLVKTGGAQ